MFNPIRLSHFPFLLSLVHLALFLLHFVVPVFSTIAAATSNEDLIEFLFQNQQICGNPFSDAQWVPVLDLCEIKCDEERELCMENDEMKQQCTKLPDVCVRSWTLNKSANLRSSNVVIVTRSPPQKQTPAANGRKVSQLATTVSSLSARNTARSKKQLKQYQQQLQRHFGRDGFDGTERRNVGERRRSPAAQIALKTTTTKAMPTTLGPTAARQEMEAKGKKGPQEKGKERWTLIEVKRRQEEGKKKKKGTGDRKGPHILQSVIDLLKEE